ncbi:hypothetical protein BC826DRAFT_1000544 [Russula brevipes]|nr:hypothetical protein BC826DRAFT_1000544 [Russula brevipes]
MGWFGDDHPVTEAHKTCNDTPSHEHKAKLSHELVGGAAAFEAAKAYRDHEAKNGKPPSHAKAKEIFAGLSGVAVDRIVETKGLDFIDAQKAKRHAQDHGDEHLSKQY